MKSRKSGLSLWSKLVLWLTGSLVATAVLLGGSYMLRPKVHHTPVATAPADHPRRPAAEAASESMANLLLLFGLITLAVGVVSAIWLVIHIRQSRPAWMTQTKYPRRR